MRKKKKRKKERKNASDACVPKETLFIEVMISPTWK